MDIQENTIYTKYTYLVPKKSRISKKQFRMMFQEYVKNPQRKKGLLKKLRELSIKKGKSYKMKKSTNYNKTKRRLR